MQHTLPDTFAHLVCKCADGIDGQLPRGLSLQSFVPHSPLSIKSDDYFSADEDYVSGFGINDVTRMLKPHLVAGFGIDNVRPLFNPTPGDKKRWSEECTTSEESEESEAGSSVTDSYLTVDTADLSSVSPDSSAEAGSSSGVGQTDACSREEAPRLLAGRRSLKGRSLETAIRLVVAARRSEKESGPFEVATSWTSAPTHGLTHPVCTGNAELDGNWSSVARAAVLQNSMFENDIIMNKFIYPPRCSGASSADKPASR